MRFQKIDLVVGPQYAQLIHKYLNFTLLNQTTKLTQYNRSGSGSIALNRKKIINDPVYGFITVHFETALEIISHPWFQRLSRIRQLGLTYLVYPGALHTRFHHAIGAMHLMSEAIETLRSKGHKISREESEGACIAILLHDIGHGPYSHALENLLVKGVSHEDLSGMLMEKLNKQFSGKLEEAISIFNNTHPKKFLHQLVSSQLDVDRLDYLNRDSFFTGVSEGVISSDRIIKMLEVVDGNLAVEEKGIYSVEKFITARRLMYWQVYLHKTVLAAEHLLINIVKRARELALAGTELFGTPALLDFLRNDYRPDAFSTDQGLLEKFAALDDFDVMASVKVWSKHSDKVLSILCNGLINRNLYKIEIRKEAFSDTEIQERQHQVASALEIERELAAYFVFARQVENNAYDSEDDKINILFKTGQVLDIAESSDNFNISSLTRPVRKHFLCTWRLSL
jgi:HD superfamily phosphohydrolase